MFQQQAADQFLRCREDADAGEVCLDAALAFDFVKQGVDALRVEHVGRIRIEPILGHDGRAVDAEHAQ